MSTAPLPGHAAVVVIGGGVMGCSTLYHLARLGVRDAVLLERNRLTSGTTWHSAAQVRALRSTQGMTNLVRHSIELYPALEAETGQAVGWINRGSLSIATTPDRLTHIRRQEALAGLFGVCAASIAPGEAKERWPLMKADDVIGAVWSPDDGRVGPSDLCAALAKGARARGAGIFEGVAVTGIVTERGRVTAVETTAGRVACDAVAVCAGLWSRRVAAMAGAQAPVWPCEHFYLLTRPVEGIAGNLPTLSDHDGHLYLRDESGGLLVGCFEPMGKPLDPDRLGEDFAFSLLPEDWDHFEPMMRNALHRVPALETAEAKMLLNGPESFTPDGSFLLGETAETRGLFLGCGMNSVGVATGGGAGMALARCIVEGAPPFDLSEADPMRFPDTLNSAAALAARAPEVLGRHYEIAYPGRQWTTARDLRHPPLHAGWVAAGARFGQAFGWERPLWFGGGEAASTFGRPGWFDHVAAEVAAAHGRAAVFDLSTYGKIEVTGPDAERFLQRVCANDMARAPGRAIYTSMLNGRSGIEGDLVALRLSNEHYRLVTGTAMIRHDLAWLRRHVDDECVTIRDATDEFALLALAGPEAALVAARAGAPELAGLGRFRCAPAEIAGVPVTAAAVSYVGEAGCEIACAADRARPVCDALLAAGARPAGLYAQTSMRIEKRHLAWGHELDSGITPLEAGLGFAIGWDTEFIGREALLARRDAGVGSRIVSILLDDAAAMPIGGEPVLLAGEPVGRTTSAAFGHRVGRPVALAILSPEAARAGEAAVEVDIARQLLPGRASAGAAFDPEGRRMRRRAAPVA